ncbi:MAG: TRAP transporter small permease subunit [Syntrophaceae bacterium]|nr:TRAP transporter small permease subunit [Syntrophaceae bacterium]
MKLWSMIERAIDFIVEVMGRIGWLLILYCMILGVIDVFLRYVLNKPSLWISTTVQAVVVLIACMGGAYALHHGAFVKLDLFYAKFSTRKKAICDIVTSIFSFLFLGVLMWKGTTAALLSIKLKQVTPTGVPIPIYPIKTLIPVAAFMVLLVVNKKLVDDIKTVISHSEK